MAFEDYRTALVPDPSHRNAHEDIGEYRDLARAIAGYRAADR